VRAYDPELAYGQSKTANILFAVEATRRWADDGITANALHPGAIVDTNLSRHMAPDVRAALVDSGRYMFKTVEQGAATSVLLAASPLLDGIGGRYFEDCAEAEPAAHALDPDAAERLWDLSELSLPG
jgi:NAD(P)-dependent dehydrogenase (short-subunit alcohol dehydrogenase family)